MSKRSGPPLRRLERDWQEPGYNDQFESDNSYLFSGEHSDSSAESYGCPPEKRKINKKKPFDPTQSATKARRPRYEHGILQRGIKRNDTRSERAHKRTGNSERRLANIYGGERKSTQHKLHLRRGDAARESDYRSEEDHHQASEAEGRQMDSRHKEHHHHHVG